MKHTNFSRAVKLQLSLLSMPEAEASSEPVIRLDSIVKQHSSRSMSFRHNGSLPFKHILPYQSGDMS